MNASFMHQEKADRIMRRNVKALQNIAEAMASMLERRDVNAEDGSDENESQRAYDCDIDAFDNLAAAAKDAIDNIGDARHLW